MATQLHLAPGSGKTELGITYLSGCIRPETLQHKPDLGFLITPLMGNKPPQASIGVHAHDNGVWSEFISGGKKAFDLDRFLHHLDQWHGVRMTCLFATAPDVVGDWQATLERSAPVLAEIRKRDYRAALVAQDGLEDHTDQIPWDDFDVLFLGGGQSKKYLSPTNRVSVKACKCARRCKHKRKWVGEWKCTPGAARLVAEARRRGKDVHMGRVNSLKRLRYAQSIGCTSADGTILQFPSRAAEVQGWTDALNPGKQLPQASCPVCRWHAQAVVNTFPWMTVDDVMQKRFQGGCPHTFRFQATPTPLPQIRPDLVAAAA